MAPLGGTLMIFYSASLPHSGLRPEWGREVARLPSAILVKIKFCTHFSICYLEKLICQKFYFLDINQYDFFSSLELLNTQTKTLKNTRKPIPRQEGIKKIMTSNSCVFFFNTFWTPGSINKSFRECFFQFSCPKNILIAFW